MVRFAALAVGALLGAVAVIGTQVAVKATGTNTFCSGCHSMTIPHAEYSKTAHYSNRLGLQVHCADCHIPHDYPEKLVTKIVVGTKDIVQELRGVLATEAQFAEKRTEMAEKVWARLKVNDSAQCRHCHDTNHMSAERQSEKARSAHAMLAQAGTTCIDCHKGVAHRSPQEVAAEAAAKEAAPAEIWGQYAAAETNGNTPKVAAKEPPVAPIPAEIGALLNKGLCVNCHESERDQAGPSFAKSAEKYRGRDDALKSLTAFLRSGQGHLAVPLNDGELERALTWVLAR